MNNYRVLFDHLDAIFMASKEATEGIDNRKYDVYLPSRDEAIAHERLIFSEYLNEHGVSGYADFLQNRLRQWEDQSVRIAMVGSSGQGTDSVFR